MIKIIHREYAQELENKVVQSGSIASSLDLCEQLSNSFCSQFQRDFRNYNRIIIFAGPSQNGAKALAIGRILANLGNTVEAILLNPHGKLSDDCRTNQRRLSDAGVPVREVTTSFNPPLIAADDIVIDGIVGMEQTTPFQGDMAQVARYINTKAKRIVSIDLPSGLLPEDNSNNLLQNVIKASHTYTFHGPKLAFLLPENAPYVGEWKIINIGLENSAPTPDIRRYLFTSADLDCMLPKRERHANKYDFGRIAIIAGSKGMIGAAILAGQAAMRSGAGHVTLHIPSGYAQTIHSTLPEALVQEDKNTEFFSMFPNPNRYDTIAIGCGLGRNFDSATALEGLLSQYRKPMVFDADAIHLLAANKSLLEMLPEDSVLTPHTGEFDALAGASASDYERLMKAQQLAQKYRVNIALKGRYTAICSKGGKIIFNTSGNPGMASAGTGDVLTGVITALIGQGQKPLIACLFGAFICGHAGDLYALEFSEESLMARDVIAYLPKVFKYFKTTDSYYGM